MNLRIKSAYYEALNKNEIYPPWAIVFQPPKHDVQPETNKNNNGIEKKSSQRNAHNLI